MTLAQTTRVAGALLLALAMAHTPDALAQERSPVAARDASRQAPVADVAGDFYAWYLAELKSNRDPLNDDPTALSTKVSKALVREIQRRMASPDGLDADYFLQAQDYYDDWLDHVTAQAVRVSRSSATLHVDLGANPSTRHRLIVTLIREDARWKIRRVATR